MPKPRVLVVDDEGPLRQMLLLVLGRHGYEIAGEAANGRLGVEAARITKPDLIVMDLRMPEMNGIEATRAIKEVDPEVTILIFSAYADASLMKAAEEAGAAGWVLKGSRPQELLDEMERATSPRATLSPHEEA